MTKDNNTGKNKDFYDLGKKMFDRLNPVQPVQPVQEPVGSLNISRYKGHLVNHDFDYFGELPDGDYPLYATPPMPVQPVQPAASNLLQIIAAAYQIAGAYDAPAHVLDVLANPEAATQAQVDALLPFVRPQQEQLIGCVGHDCQHCKEMQDWEAVAADQAMTIALLRSEQDPMATKDAERFAWWFSEDDTKHEFLTTYMEGVRNKWTIANWRAAIDAARDVGDKT